VVNWNVPLCPFCGPVVETRTGASLVGGKYTRNRDNLLLFVIPPGGDRFDGTYWAREAFGGVTPPALIAAAGTSGHSPTSLLMTDG
jgi:hypothetical protein